MVNSKHSCNSLLIVLSGPSGVGKDAVLNKMREKPDNYHFTVTATTREIREGETAGQDYIFLSFLNRYKMYTFFEKSMNKINGVSSIFKNAIFSKSSPAKSTRRFSMIFDSL